jgi:DNA-binding transcriptional ArsR family regulator
MDIIEEKEAALFAVLADPTRLRLFKMLANQGESGALCVNALANILGVTQSAISQHLRVLRNMGLVRGERRGFHIHYTLIQEAVAGLRETIHSALELEDMEDNSISSNHKEEKDVSTS